MSFEYDFDYDVEEYDGCDECEFASLIEDRESLDFLENDVPYEDYSNYLDDIERIIEE